MQADDAAPAQIASAVVDADARKDGPTPSRFKVTVSNDRLEAWLEFVDSNDEKAVETDAVFIALGSAQIARTDAVERRVQAFAAEINGGGNRSKRFLIAEGRAAVEGSNGDFIRDESLDKTQASWQEDAQIDYYTFNTIVTVEEGATIGRIIPATPGEEGVDVHGQVLKPKRRPKEVEVGPDLRVSEDGSGVVIARVAGKVTYKLERLSIDKVLDIRGDVDFKSGSIDSHIDVHIKGDVLDGFSVKSRQSITVGGVIGAATVEAGGDVLVRGGILGRHKGAVKAGGDIAAKFGEEADLQAQGDIVIGKELMNSQVQCQGHLLAGHGDVVGGRVYAREGIELRSIGSEAEVPTEVIVGVHPAVYAEATCLDADIMAKRASVEVLQVEVGPLMADIKRLMPAQKERATELLSQIKTAEAEISEAERRRDELLEAAKAEGEPRITVSKTICRGTSIRIDRKKTIFNQDLRGPVTIERQKVKSATEIVAVNPLTGSVKVLPSAEVVKDRHRAEREQAQP